MHAQDAEFGEPLGSLMVVVFPIELRGTLIRQGELPLVVGKVGYGEGYYEVSARDVLGPCAPVDCRIVRRSSPIINLLFTPCTLKKRNVQLLSKIRRVYRGASPPSIVSPSLTGVFILVITNTVGNRIGS